MNIRGSVLLLLLSAVVVTSDDNALAQASSLSGGYIVTVTPSGGNTSCSDRSEFQARTLQWLVASQGSQVNVTVQGDSFFPRLVGNWTGPQLVLAGTGTSLEKSISDIGSTAFFNINVTSPQPSSVVLDGLERVMFNEKRGGVWLPCFMDFHLQGKRQ